MQRLQSSRLLLGGRSHGGVALLAHRPGTSHFSEHWERLWAWAIDVRVTEGEATVLLQPMVSSKAPLRHKAPCCSCREKKQAADAQAQVALGIPHNSWGAVLQREGGMSWGKQPPKGLFWSTVLALVLENHQGRLPGLA